jgi:hypothetical protein
VRPRFWLERLKVRKKQVGFCRRRVQDNIKIRIKELGLEDIDYIHLNLGRYQSGLSWKR